MPHTNPLHFFREPVGAPRTRGVRSRSIPILSSLRPPPSDTANRILLRPAAFLKLMYCCHAAATEIGGFGISSATDPLVIDAFALVAQTCSSVTVAFDDASVADHAERYVEAGIGPDRSMRIWIHTHPGESATPSMTDERTFASSFGGCDWSAMLIQGRGSERYCRLQFTAGPGTSVLVPVLFDWASLPTWLEAHADELPAIIRGWSAELEMNVSVDPVFDSWMQGADDPTVRRGFWFDEPASSDDRMEGSETEALIDAPGDPADADDRGDWPEEGDHVRL